MTNLSSHMSTKPNIQNLICKHKSSQCFDIDTWVWFVAIPAPPASPLSLQIKFPLLLRHFFSTII